MQNYHADFCAFNSTRRRLASVHKLPDAIQKEFIEQRKEERRSQIAASEERLREQRKLDQERQRRYRETIGHTIRLMAG